MARDPRLRQIDRSRKIGRQMRRGRAAGRLVRRVIKGLARHSRTAHSLRRRR